MKEIICEENGVLLLITSKHLQELLEGKQTHKIFHFRNGIYPRNSGIALWLSTGLTMVRTWGWMVLWVWASHINASSKQKQASGWSVDTDSPTELHAKPKLVKSKYRTIHLSRISKYTIWEKHGRLPLQRRILSGLDFGVTKSIMFFRITLNNVEGEKGSGDELHSTQYITRKRVTKTSRVLTASLKNYSHQSIHNSHHKCSRYRTCQGMSPSQTHMVSLIHNALHSPERGKLQLN